MDEYATIDEYIEQFHDDIRNILIAMRETIHAAAPEAEEAIRYGIPTFRLNGTNLAHFAAFKDHIGFFPTPSAIEKFKKELAQYRTSKGTVQFPLSGPVPVDLITEIIRFRKTECMKKPAGKKAGRS